MTKRAWRGTRRRMILIHTSVKLVTKKAGIENFRWHILIHTSVKLVTEAGIISRAYYPDFNPHEREARDIYSAGMGSRDIDFNPHEREARDAGIVLSQV